MELHIDWTFKIVLDNINGVIVNLITNYFSIIIKFYEI